MSVLPKTQFPKNAKTQFENANTQFENSKTQFGNCKTIKNRKLYASHQSKFNSLNQFWCNQQKIFLKPHFYTWVSWKTNFKNAKSQFEQGIFPPENPKTQFKKLEKNLILGMFQIRPIFQSLSVTKPVVTQTTNGYQMKDLDNIFSLRPCGLLYFL